MYGTEWTDLSSKRMNGKAQNHQPAQKPVIPWNNNKKKDNKAGGDQDNTSKPIKENARHWMKA